MIKASKRLPASDDESSGPEYVSSEPEYVPSEPEYVSPDALDEQNRIVDSLEAL